MEKRNILCNFYKIPEGFWGLYPVDYINMRLLWHDLGARKRLRDFYRRQLMLGWLHLV
ncbi:hypothetical protein HDZ31DRAFT_68669 [Schizophyllum fasciatum]